MGQVAEVKAGFYNGVSQQSPSLRLDTQGEEQINGFSSILSGLSKRVGSSHLKRAITECPYENITGRLINRGNEAYMALFIPEDPVTPIRVFNLLDGGSECTLRYGDYTPSTATFTEDLAYKAYAQIDPDDLKLMTIVDYTFVLDRSRVPGVTGGAVHTPENYAYVWVKTARPEGEYTITIDSNAQTLVTDSATATNANDTTVIAGGLKGLLDTAGYITEQRGSVLRISVPPNAIITTSDPYADQGMVLLHQNAGSIHDLPPYGWDGMVLRIHGDSKKKEDWFYMKYSSPGDGTKGIWSESLGWGENNSLDPLTMPFLLIRTAANEFTYTPAQWTDREVGDEDLIPAPSFVGQKINNFFFQNNRLGILAGNNVIYSESGEYFNFFGTSVIDLLDSDPIDLACSDRTDVTLYSSAIYDKDLLLFGDHKQFTVTSGGSTFKPSTVSVSGTTDYIISPSADPVTLGSSIFFASPGGKFQSVYEYMIQPETLVEDATDISAHAPRYLLDGTSWLSKIDNMKALFLWSKPAADQGIVYVYLYHWMGAKKAQSSWSKWQFNGKILHADARNQTLYLVIQYPSGDICIEYVNLDDEAFGLPVYTAYLDRQVEVVGAYDETTDITTWTLPYQDVDTDFRVVDPVSSISLPNVAVEGNALQVRGDFTKTLYDRDGVAHTPAYKIGRTFEFRYVFSPWYLTNREGHAILTGTLLLRTLECEFSNTGQYRFEITPKYQEMALGDEFTAAFVDRSYLKELLLFNGSNRFLVMGVADQTEIALVNDSHLPVYLHAASFEGTYTARARSI